MENSKFKIGDRVAVYGWGGTAGSKIKNGQHGTVIESPIGETQGQIYVALDNTFRREEDRFHPKQCRLLKKKVRRRIWLPPNWDNGRDFQPVNILTNPERVGDGSVEFIEARKKK